MLGYNPVSLLSFNPKLSCVLALGVFSSDPLALSSSPCECAPALCPARSPRWAVLSPPPPWPPPLGGSVSPSCLPQPWTQAGWTSWLPRAQSSCGTCFLAKPPAAQTRPVSAKSLKGGSALKCCSLATAGRQRPLAPVGNQEQSQRRARARVRVVGFPEVGSREAPRRPPGDRGVNKLDPGHPVCAGGAGGVGVFGDSGGRGAAPVWAPPPAQGRPGSQGAGRVSWAAPSAVCLLNTDSC